VTPQTHDHLSLQVMMALDDHSLRMLVSSHAQYHRSLLQLLVALDDHAFPVLVAHEGQDRLSLLFAVLVTHNRQDVLSLRMRVVHYRQDRPSFVAVFWNIALAKKNLTPSDCIQKSVLNNGAQPRTMMQLMRVKSDRAIRLEQPCVQ